jgi:hypothetical protein
MYQDSNPILRCAYIKPSCRQAAHNTSAVCSPHGVLARTAAPSSPHAMYLHVGLDSSYWHRKTLVLWLVVWTRRMSARDATGPVSDPPALMSLSALQCVVQKFMPKEFVVI